MGLILYDDDFAWFSSYVNHDSLKFSATYIVKTGILVTKAWWRDRAVNILEMGRYYSGDIQTIKPVVAILEIYKLRLGDEIGLLICYKSLQCYLQVKVVFSALLPGSYSSL